MATSQLTIHEAAKKMGKSVQTLRRMIKRGLLPHEQIRTPQGFSYLIPQEALTGRALPFSEPTPQTLAVDSVDSSDHYEVAVEMKTPLKRGEMPCLPEIHRAHQEQVFLMGVIENLQQELDREKKRPKSFLARLFDYLYA